MNTVVQFYVLGVLVILVSTLIFVDCHKGVYPIILPKLQRWGSFFQVVADYRFCGIVLYLLFS